MKNNLKVTILVVLILSFLSKGLGFLRDLLITSYIGFNELTDALFISLSIITLLFSAFNTTIRTTFAPLFSSRFKDNSVVVLEEYRDLRFVLIIVLGMISILIFTFPEVILSILTPGIKGETFELSSDFLKILSILLIFYGIFYITIGLLQALKIFKTVEVASILNNLCIILSIFLLYKSIGIYSVVLGYIVGSVIQAVYSSIILKIKVKYKIPFVLTYNRELIRKYIDLTKYVLIGSVVTQLTVFSDKFFASFLNTGSITALHYANIVKNLPLTIIILVVTNILFTNLAIYHKESKLHFLTVIKKQLNYLLYLTGPVVIIFFTYSNEIIKLIFYRGEFSSKGVDMISSALAAYSLGLLFWVFKEVLTKASYAAQNTKIPLIITTLSLLLNILFNFLLVKSFGHIGIALGTSISFLISSVVLVFLLNKNNVINGVYEFFLILFKHLLVVSFSIGISIIFKVKLLNFLPQDENFYLGSIVILLVYISLGKKLGVDLKYLLRKE